MSLSGVNAGYLDVNGTANTGAFTTTSASVTDATQSTSKDTCALIVTQGSLGVESLSTKSERLEHEISQTLQTE